MIIKKVQVDVQWDWSQRGYSIFGKHSRKSECKLYKYFLLTIYKDPVSCATKCGVKLHSGENCPNRLMRAYPSLFSHFNSYGFHITL